MSQKTLSKFTCSTKQVIPELEDHVNKQLSFLSFLFFPFYLWPASLHPADRRRKHQQRLYTSQLNNSPSLSMYVQLLSKQNKTKDNYIKNQWITHMQFLVIVKACRRRKTLPLNVLFVLQNDAHGHEHIQSIVYTSPYVFFILAYKTNNRHFFLTTKIIISSVKARILQWGLLLLDQLPIQWVSLSLWVSHCC